MRHALRLLLPAVALGTSLLLLLAACTPSGSTPSFTVAPPAGGGSATPSSGASAGAPTTGLTPSPTTGPEASLGFSPGTATAPRVIEISTDDQLNFNPGFIQAAMGETVTFKIHNLGKAVHEFMVGPLAAAFADTEGTPEVADIAGGTTAELTFTFSGSGPFAFACHEPGHFEHGMAGYIQMVGPGAAITGTAANPRLVHLDTTDALRFNPDQVDVAAGESIRFILTNSGTAVHEFQVGPADKVAADEVDGKIVVEKDQLVAGSTRAVDYTFSGAPPFAFACHEPGHYEAGMKGTIVLAGG